MKLIKQLSVIILILLISNIANAQFTHWERDTSISFENVKESPVTHEVFNYNYVTKNIYKYDPNNMLWDSIYNINSYVINNNLENMLFDANGVLYIVVNDYQSTHHILKDSLGNFVQFLDLDTSQLNSVLFFDSYNNLWGRDINDMPVVLQAGNYGTAIQPLVLQGANFMNPDLVKKDNNGNIWFYSNGGTKSTNSLSPDYIYKYDIVSETFADSINIAGYNIDYYSISLHVAPNNNLYVSANDQTTYNNKLFKFNNSSLDSIPGVYTMFSPNFYNLIITENNDIWIPSDYDGLYYIRPNDSIYNIPLTPFGYNLSYPNISYGQGRYLYITDDSHNLFKIDLFSNFVVNVNYQGTFLDDSDVEIKIFSNTINSVAGPDSVLGGMSYNGTYGYFEFSGQFNQDSVYLKANLTAGSSYNGQLLNSYYAQNDTTYVWDNATILSPQSGSSDTLTINMYEPQAVTAGSGVAAGNISYGTPGTKAAGEPVPGAEVIVEQEPNDDPVAMSVTDSNGDYSIGNLPDNINFRMTVDVPGIPQIQTYTLNYSPGNNNYTNLNFYVDTTGIYTDTTVGTKQIITDNFKLSVYPIPSNKPFVNIDYTVNNDNSLVNYKIVDINGKVILQEKLNNQQQGNYSIRTKNLENGIYFVQFNVNNDFVVKKFIISK